MSDPLHFEYTQHGKVVLLKRGSTAYTLALTGQRKALDAHMREVDARYRTLAGDKGGATTTPTQA